MMALKARKARANVAVKLREVRGFLVLVFMVSLASSAAWLAGANLSDVPGSLQCSGGWSVRVPGFYDNFSTIPFSQQSLGHVNE
jgi:hypothetical protein